MPRATATLRPLGWRGTLALVAGAGLALGVVAWRAAIVRVERASVSAGPAAPTCRGVVARGRFAPAADRARLHARGLLAERRIPGLS